MLAGEPPFTGPNPQTVRAKMLSGPPPSVRRARPAITAQLNAAIDKALAPAPADRYNSLADFARTLGTAEGGMQSATTGPSGGRSIFKNRAVSATVAAVATAIIASVLVLRLRGPSRAPIGDSALAVLPFENDGDTSNAYFADGITNEIRGKLTALPALSVIARASSNQYRRSDKSPQQIAHELGARYLLTGVVRWETSASNARRVRVSPELVQLSQESAPRTIWQQTYDTTLADVFQVQSAVASKVAANLGVVLNAPTEAQIAQKPTQNLAAYEAYLRSTAVDGTDLPSLRRALADAEEAVALDSNFAAALARVGRLHAVIYSNGTQAPAEAKAAEIATMRAIALDSNAYQSYVARALYWRIVKADEARARADLERALRLAPSSVDVLRTLGQVEAGAGQWDQGLAHMRQATALDPRSPIAADRLGRALLWLRRYPEARASAERGLASNPDNLALIENRAMSFAGEGDLAGARRSLHQVPGIVDRGALLSYISNYWDTYWIMDSADVALAKTLPVSEFDGDVGVWSVVHTELFMLTGDSARAREYADTAARVTEQVIRQNAGNWQSLMFHAYALAILGKRAESIRDRDRAIAIAVATGDQWSTIPYAYHLVARIDVALGDRDAAIAVLGKILEKPYVISPAWLRIDPTWNSLRGDPRFQKLANGRDARSAN